MPLVQGRPGGGNRGVIKPRGRRHYRCQQKQQAADNGKGQQIHERVLHRQLMPLQRITAVGGPGGIRCPATLVARHHLV